MLAILLFGLIAIIALLLVIAACQRQVIFEKTDDAVQLRIENRRLLKELDSRPDPVAKIAEGLGASKIVRDIKVPFRGVPATQSRGTHPMDFFME